MSGLAESKIIVFDLDDTLISPVESEKVAKKKNLPCYAREGAFGHYVCVLRPYSEEVLSRAAEQFDEVVLWSLGSSSDIVELLDLFSISKYFSDVVGNGDALMGDSTTSSVIKDFNKLAQKYGASIDNVVMIQDTMWDDNDCPLVVPSENRIYINPFYSDKLFSSYDRTLLKAYDVAIQKVFGNTN